MVSLKLGCYDFFKDTPHTSSGVLTQCTFTSAVAGAAVTAVLVLLVVVVVQSAVIWHQRRSAPAFSQWYKISEEDFLAKNIGVIMSIKLESMT